MRNDDMVMILDIIILLIKNKFFKITIFIVNV